MSAYMRNAGVALLSLLCVTATGLAQDQFFDSNGVRIRYVEQGSGDVVVLLHGNGSTLKAWIDAGVFPQLAQEYRVIALDARGHGQSGKPHDVHAYGREMGLDVIRLLDHLGIRRAHIVGYSMGASITAQLLTTHAERFRSATLGGAAGRFRWTEAQAATAEQEAAERERECVSRPQPRPVRPGGPGAFAEGDRHHACTGRRGDRANSGRRWQSRWGPHRFSGVEAPAPHGASGRHRGRHAWWRAWSHASARVPRCRARVPRLPSHRIGALNARAPAPRAAPAALPLLTAAAPQLRRMLCTPQPVQDAFKAWGSVPRSLCSCAA
jgi:pimeloyl-ACP methyl ester carboxylesterase